MHGLDTPLWVSLPVGASSPHLIHNLLEPPNSASQMASPSVRTFLHSSRRASLYFTTGRPFPPKLSLPTGILTPSNTWFLEPARVHNPNGILIGSALFAQITANRPYTLQWAPFPQISPFHGVSGPHLIHDSFWPPSNTRFLRHTWVFNANGISIGYAVFAGLTTVTDRQTDRQIMLLCR